jgi:MerR family transcriptional regulator, thiopeptide resistance regulator
LRDYTVKQLADLSGVSVRALHHYDEIGLLKPAHVGVNGYRYYGREELLRLQQVLFHRELGLSLDEIRRVLDAPDFDRASALRLHRQKLEDEIQRCRRLIQTIDGTLAELGGGKPMNERAFYQGLDPEKWAAQDQWAIERYGPAAEAAVKQRNEVMNTWIQGDYDRHAAGFQAMWTDFTCALSQGVPADSDHVRRIARHLYRLLSEAAPTPLSRARYLAVAEIYAEHPHLRSSLDGKAPGLTDYVLNAMRAFSNEIG